MKNLVFLILIITTFFSCSSLKQKKECTEILDKEFLFTKNDAEFEKELKIIEKCGKLDSIDRVFFSPQMIGLLMVKLIPENDKLTYRVFINKIDKIRNTKQYQKQKEKFYFFEKIKKRLIDKNNWNQDKLILEKIGLQGKELNDFKKYISKFYGTNTTYGVAYILFENNKKENKIKTSFKFKKFDDYEKVLKTARSKKKKILLFFTSYADINSRKMEEVIFTDDKIKRILTENYLSYALYVDSRKELKEKYISKRTGKEIKTVGNKLAELEIEKFNSVYQPYFVIIDENGKILKHKGFTENINEFLDFLKIDK